MGALIQGRRNAEELREIQLEEVNVEAMTEPAGLRNIGNTCYMNAALQCLLQTDRLSTALSKSLSGQGSSTQQVLIESYRSVLSQPHSTSRLRRLKRAFNGIHRRYAGFKQMDSNEFFLDLMNAIVELSPKVKEDVGGLFRVDMTDRKKCSVCGTEKESKYDLLSLSLPLPPAKVVFTAFPGQASVLKPLLVTVFESCTVLEIRNFILESTGMPSILLVLASPDSVLKIIPDNESLHALNLKVNTLYYFPKEENDVVIEMRVTEVGLLTKKVVECVVRKTKRPLIVKDIEEGLMNEMKAGGNKEGGVINVTGRISKSSCFRSHFVALLDSQDFINSSFITDDILRLEFISDQKPTSRKLINSDLRRVSNDLELIECVRFYNKEQIPDGTNMIHCEKCEKDVPFSQCSYITQTSNYLVLCLQRYSSVESQKDYRLITIPKSFSFDCEAGPQTYRLYAVIKHRGDNSRGHYTSVVRKGEDWFYCDDRTVTRVEGVRLEESLQEDAYILFYERTLER